jgi:site-specific DNA-methyltransferase (adenine-specific)
MPFSQRVPRPSLPPPPQAQFSESLAAPRDHSLFPSASSFSVPSSRLHALCVKSVALRLVLLCALCVKSVLLPICLLTSNFRSSLDTIHHSINDPCWSTRSAESAIVPKSIPNSAPAAMPRRSLGEGGSLPSPVFEDRKHHIRIFQGDCLDILAALPADSIDLIFADPPYFLSNNGITCHAGRMVSVNKGAWDKLPGPDIGPGRARYDKVHEFNHTWLAACQRVLKPNGTIWVSGTSHVIHSVGFAMQQLEFKLLNDISWVKPNPPPNLSCRYFTHATETIIWAAKNKKSRHTFHYQHMKEIAGGKQMKSVWTIPPPESSEKKFGKHPTQKPVALLERILLASSSEGDTVLDPFMGSGTAAIAALRLSRQVLAVDSDQAWIQLTLIRLCSDLVQVCFSAICIQIDLDPSRRSMDRSRSPENRQVSSPIPTRLVRRDRNYHFVGSRNREVVFAVSATDMDEAWSRFHNSDASEAEILFVIKTETEIYLAQ